MRAWNRDLALKALDQYEMSDIGCMAGDKGAHAAPSSALEGMLTRKV